MFKKLCMFAIATIVSCALFVGDCDARGGRGGGGFSRGSSSSSRSSSSSSSSSSRPSSPAPSVRPSNSGSRPSASDSTPATSSKATAPTPSPKAVKSQTDMRVYEKAKSNGKAFTNKESAVNDFKTKNAGKLTGKYDKEPAKRPDHIPQTTKGADGNTYNITYNQAGGGYGYTNSLGAFILYDAISDAAMMSTMMNRQGYYVGAPPVVATTSAPVAVVHSGHGFFYYFFWFIGIAAVVGFVVVIIRNS